MLYSITCFTIERANPNERAAFQCHDYYITITSAPHTARKRAVAYSTIQKRRYCPNLQFLQRRCVRCVLSCHNVRSASLCAPSLQTVQLPPHYCPF